MTVGVSQLSRNQRFWRTFHLDAAALRPIRRTPIGPAGAKDAGLFSATPILFCAVIAQPGGPDLLRATPICRVPAAQICWLAIRGRIHRRVAIDRTPDFDGGRR